MFHRLPDVSRLAQQGKTEELIRFLGSDRGIKKNGAKRELALDEAMRTLEGAEAALLLPLLGTAAVDEKNLYPLCRFAILAANLGVMRLYRESYFPKYQMEPEAAAKDACVQLEARYLNEEAMRQVVAWMGGILDPAKHQDSVVQGVAAHLRRLYAATTGANARREIQAYEGTMLARGEEHTDSHADARQSEETAYNGWFCDHNDTHDDQHTDIAAKPEQSFRL